jgi:hypothetical protein
MRAVDSVRRDRAKAVRYYNAVRENLRRCLDGDPGYAQHGTRNPLYRCHATLWGDLTPRKLGQLHTELTPVWSSDIVSTSGEDTGAGRNSRINRALWRWAVDHPHHCGRELEATAHLLNSLEEPPLDSYELEGIIRSVVNGLIRDRPREGTPWPEDLSRKGGQARAHATQAMAAKSVEVRQKKSNSLRQQAHALRDQGWTVRAIAEEIGRSVESVSNYLNAPPPGS